MRKPLTFALTATLLITGCATTTAPSLPLNATYQVEWIGDRPLIDRSHVTITFADDGRAHGHAGCNRWFATYQSTGDQLSFSQAGATRMMCAPALMEQEGRFFQALGQVERWEQGNNGELRLWYSQGQALRLFAEKP